MRGSIEGFYGPPFSHQQRLDHMTWLATQGLDTFAYAPKDDPYHRRRWREPHPAPDMDAFSDLVAHGKSCRVDFCYTISPGLDWGPGDEDTLVAKLRSIRDLGCQAMAILWDDVAPGGAELGEMHGRANARVVSALEGVRWWTVGTDYAVGSPTPYLEAFARKTPPEMLVAWTGPYVVGPGAGGEVAERLVEALGRPLLLWENFPVNDGAMSGVLHLGPYPERDPALVEASAGVLFNTMLQPIASRVGIACGAAFWRDPGSDREAAWRGALAHIPGLEPLARASRSWVDAPGPPPDLVRAAEAAPDDPTLRTFLEAGCRSGLAEDVAAEVGPWLEAWEAEAQAMLAALDVLERGYRSGPRGVAAGVLWMRAQRLEQQVFGIRRAVYPVIQQRGRESTCHPASVVWGPNLTDLVCQRALRQELREARA